MTEKIEKVVSMPSVEQVESELKRIDYRKKFFKTLFSTVSILLVVAAIAVLISTMFLPVVQVSGDSMEPTLTNGDILVTVKAKKVKKSELYCVSWQNKLLLKRIIGMPGDMVNIDSDGNVFINNEPLDEPYLIEKSPGLSDIEFPFQVPEDKYFILGDKRDVSVDSRNQNIGCVSSDQIVGRVLFRVWKKRSDS